MYGLLIIILIGCECISANDLVDCNFCVRKCCHREFSCHLDLNFMNGSDSGLQNDSVHLSAPIYNISTTQNDLEKGEYGLMNCTDQKLRYFNVGAEPLQQIENLYYSRYKTKHNYMEYCVDKKDEIVTYYSCDQNEFAIPISAKIINSAFLLVTFLIFVIIPERNFHEKAVTFHTFCLIIANIILTVNEYYNIEGDLLCNEGNAYIFLGYLLLYSRSASDFWLNILCIEIWYTFSGVYLFHRKSDCEKGLLIIFSTYAWGMPAIILVIVVLLKTSGHDSSYLYPGIDKESCCFRGVPYHVFDNGPKLILFIFNTVLNILTVINIQKVNKASSVARRTDSKCPTCVDDLRFILYWKLCFITTYGFIYFFHSILVMAYDSPVNPRSITYFIYYSESFATTYGVVFFVTFVFKKRIWKGLKQRYEQLGKLKVYETCVSTRVFRKLGDNKAPDIHLTTFYSTIEECGQ